MIGLPSFFKAEWYSTICTYHIALSIYPLIDTWVTSTSWLLWIRMQWPWVCKYPCVFNYFGYTPRSWKVLLFRYAWFLSARKNVFILPFWQWACFSTLLSNRPCGLDDMGCWETSKEKYPPRNSFFLLTSSKGPLTLTALRCGENFPLK